MSDDIHLLRPEWQKDPEQSYEYVVESLLHGRRYIRVALELWRLASHEENVAKIKAVLERAHQHDDSIMFPFLTTPDIQEFYDLLEGLGTAARNTIVDSRGIIPPERLAELRSRTKILDLGEHLGDLAVYGVAEGLAQVCELQDFLKQALDRNLHLALD